MGDEREAEQTHRQGTGNETAQTERQQCRQARNIAAAATSCCLQKVVVHSPYQLPHGDNGLNVTAAQGMCTFKRHSQPNGENN
jgi:hypothetical protein